MTDENLPEFSNGRSYLDKAISRVQRGAHARTQVGVAAPDGITTPEQLQPWLDRAQELRPRSDRGAERVFAAPLKQLADVLLSLATETGDPWNKLLSHPVFTSPVITVHPVSPEQSISVRDDGRAVVAAGGDASVVLHFGAVMAAVGLVPFIQSIATQAAQRTFEAARAMIRARAERGDGRASGPLLAIEERDGRMDFRVPSDIPDAALEALVALGERGLEELAEPDPKGRAVTVSWDADGQCWERTTHRRPRSRTGNENTSRAE
ncbi:hypothetical protein SRB5_03770 [Streptomyces sp. RB5]|uniref:Uncharacterized protein n=1 Tax=Streptomyces smaragdinus TaxID=2585196 RepID=A0A7K0C9Z1_9ACTN|nr:hypothetical protein [Streptomyces smaragdinus]MQY10270.1 hypothetical protein [Streptomyces smaragdinus]